MFHNIEIEEINERDSSESIAFSPHTLPQDLYQVIERFTRIPGYERVLPFIVAYELCPVKGLPSFPILFCCGKSGSGKSTLGELLQKLNPRAIGDYTYLQSSDTAKGWEQNIPFFRKDPNGRDKAFPTVFIDDLEPRTFNGDNGALKLSLLKQVVNANGAIRRGGPDGTPLSIEVFCKLITGSIHDLPFLEGLQELERRCLVVQHRNVDDWEDADHTEYTRNNQIENHNDFLFDLSYDESRALWFNNNVGLIKSHRKEIKEYCKKHDTIPRNRIQFVYPIIALALTCGFFETVEEVCNTFRDVFLKRVRSNGESPLQAMLREWIKGENSPYKGRFRLFEELDGRNTFDIPYSEIAKFLKAKISNLELSSRECQRGDVVAAMGLMGFTSGTSCGETVFIMGGIANDK